MPSRCVRSVLEGRVRAGPAAAFLLVLVATASGGCYWRNVPMRAPGGGTWSAATGLARAADPAAAALAAAQAARGRLGDAHAQAVLFFECFDQVGSADRVAVAVGSVFPGAEVIGCTAAGLATADAASGDRAVAVLAVGGAPSVRFSSGYVSAEAATAEAAGRQLAGRLGRPAGPSLVVLLGDPAAFDRPTWDPESLPAALGEALGGRAVVFGGLAAPHRPGGPVRIYHGQHGYAGGVAALQISGPLDWAGRTDNELLRVGPIWGAGRVQGYTVGELTSGERTLSAEAVVARYLIAQERLDGHVAWLAGDHEVPLHFAAAGDGAIRLPVRLSAGERLVVLRSGPPSGRVEALRRALDGARLFTDLGGRPPITLLALPAGPNNSFVDELGSVQAELARRPEGHAAAIAFVGLAQFAPASAPPSTALLASPSGAAAHPRCHFHQHTFAALQAAPPPVAAPPSRTVPAQSPAGP